MGNADLHPLCSTCRHRYVPTIYAATWGGGVERFPDVLHSRCARTDFVVGDGSAGQSCVAQRGLPNAMGGCGPQGVYWEAIEPKDDPPPAPRPRITERRRKLYWNLAAIAVGVVTWLIYR